MERKKHSDASLKYIFPSKAHPLTQNQLYPPKIVAVLDIFFCFCWSPQCSLPEKHTQNSATYLLVSFLLFSHSEVTLREKNLSKSLRTFGMVSKKKFMEFFIFFFENVPYGQFPKKIMEFHMGRVPKKKIRVFRFLGGGF